MKLYVQRFEGLERLLAHRAECTCCDFWRVTVTDEQWPDWWQDLFGCQWTHLFEFVFDIDSLR